MDLNIGGYNVRLLGDPHLGKRFVEGVPLHRRGDREQMMWSDFRDSYNNLEGVEFHICMGDLFNDWFVSYDTILEAAEIIHQAAYDSPWAEFVILKGNHDASKDLERTSAFDVLSKILTDDVNVWAFDSPFTLSQFVFLPWSPTETAAAMAYQIEADPPWLAAFGHWDTDPRITTGNLIPTKALAELGIPVAFTGHVHQHGEFIRDGVRVVQVGSMQPYAHGEGDMYVSLSKEGVEDRLHNYGPDWFKDKCVRVDLDPTEVWDLDLDCLQIQVRKDRMEDVSGEEVSLDGFDLNTILGESLSQFGIPDDIKAKITDKFSELRA